MKRHSALIYAFVRTRWWSLYVWYRSRATGSPIFSIFSLRFASLSTEPGRFLFLSIETDPIDSVELEFFARLAREKLRRTCDDVKDSQREGEKEGVAVWLWVFSIFFFYLYSIHSHARLLLLCSCFLTMKISPHHTNYFPCLSLTLKLLYSAIKNVKFSSEVLQQRK